MRERETLKQVYGSTLAAVDLLRLIDSMLESRGIPAGAQEREFIFHSLGHIADAQEAIEAVIPPQELL